MTGHNAPFANLLDYGELAPVPEPLGGVLAPYLRHYRLDEALPMAAGLDAGQIDCAGYRLWVQRWRPAQPPHGTVVVVHGYFDHLGLYRHLLKTLLAAGWQVILWDLPGHGLSSGERAAIDDFADYIHCLQALTDQLDERALMQGPWIGIGQSTGGAILATDALSRREHSPWQALVLLAPLVRPRGWKRARWLHDIAGPFVRSIPRTHHPNSTDADFVAFLRHGDPLQAERLPLVWVRAMRRWMARFCMLSPRALPVLILQGEQDATVDWRWNLQVLAAQFPMARIERNTRARHHLVNEHETLRQPLFTVLLDFVEAQRNDNVASVHCEISP
ncbi:alpha-beta hydrolase superfamily lysophospholipase [Kushneria sinocarnis]|uniref:Alpha-beta hydrolase superfamily lysophospholipase n=1 Tax=Kushneria sinocarnis TaxID=595502 RepID=A0A420X0Z5_9GAMM|nr:alpha/beta hydrolase [Kushneria sinocarnis]RKR07417.1 alpha-beta hydrolase superfamily lysophospholipase [Kushneria sinocarnis]